MAVSYTHLNHDEISSYPSFATPQEVGDAVVKAGFDVIETATNHIDDFGLDLIKDELNYWETNHPEVTVIGDVSKRQPSGTSVLVEMDFCEFPNRQ